MQARKEGSKGRIEQAISMARIDSIEGDDPGPPSYSYHRAPHIVLGVLLEYEHFILLVECRARLVEPSRRVRCTMWCSDASGHSRWNFQFVLLPSFDICDSHLAAHEAAKMPESEALLGALAEICVCFVAAKRRRIVNFGFALSLVLAGFAVVGVFIEIPFVSNYAFWIAIGAYVILAATQKH